MNDVKKYVLYSVVFLIIIAIVVSFSFTRVPPIVENIEEITQEAPEIYTFIHGFFRTYYKGGKYYVTHNYSKTDRKEVTGIAVFSKNMKLLSATDIAPVSKDNVEIFLGKKLSAFQEHFGEPHVLCGPRLEPAYLTDDGYILYVVISGEKGEKFDEIACIYLESVVTGSLKIFEPREKEWIQVGSP